MFGLENVRGGIQLPVFKTGLKQCRNLKSARDRDVKRSQYQTKVVINCFLQILDNTSRRAITDDAMSIKAMLHAEILYKGKLYTGPKTRWS